jgi:hypothetical protein
VLKLPGRRRARSTARALLAGISVWTLLAATTLVAAAADPGDYRIFFSRSFPESVPAYFDVAIESSGAGGYRESEDEEPLEFEVGAAELAEVLEYVKELDYFRIALESNLKVAFTGEKTFRFEGADGRTGEAKFNHTSNAAARRLLAWFHKVAGTERHRIALERAARFDRLGVNKTLLQFQISLENNRIVSPAQFIPILKKIANDKKIIRITTARAAGLLERIQPPATNP